MDDDFDFLENGDCEPAASTAGVTYGIVCMFDRY